MNETIFYYVIVHWYKWWSQRGVNLLSIWFFHSTSLIVKGGEFPSVLAGQGLPNRFWGFGLTLHRGYFPKQNLSHNFLEMCMNLLPNQKMRDYKLRGFQGNQRQNHMYPCTYFICDRACYRFAIVDHLLDRMVPPSQKKYQPFKLVHLIYWWRQFLGGS